MSVSARFGKQVVELRRLLIDLLQPNKTDALNYLDINGAAPTRYAHVVLDHRVSVDPYYQDIQVGPLPIVDGTAVWSPLEYLHTRKTKGRVRDMDADSETLYSEWIYKISAYFWYHPGSLERYCTRS